MKDSLTELEDIIMDFIIYRKTKKPQAVGIQNIQSGIGVNHLLKSDNDYGFGKGWPSYQGKTQAMAEGLSNFFAEMADGPGSNRQPSVPSNGSGTMPMTPGMPSSPQMPENNRPSSAPGTPSTMPMTPSMPSNPQMPVNNRPSSTPSAPGMMPSTPGMPSSPQMPENNRPSSMPATPSTMPFTPGLPGSPQMPVNNRPSIAPSTPSMPSTPEMPSMPSGNTQTMPSRTPDQEMTDLEFILKLYGEVNRKLAPYVQTVLQEYDFNEGELAEQLDRETMAQIVDKVIDMARNSMEEVEDISLDDERSTWGRYRLLRALIEIQVLSDIFNSRQIRNHMDNMYTNMNQYNNYNNTNHHQASHYSTNHNTLSGTQMNSSINATNHGYGFNNKFGSMNRYY